MKNNFSKKNYCKEGGAVYTAADFFNAQLNGRHLDSHVRICIQSVPMLFWLKYKKETWPRTDL